MAVSIGKVIRCSTSSGEYPGAFVLIWTWTFVMSGTASIGRRIKFHTPSPAISSTPIITSHRWRTENKRMASIIGRLQSADWGT
jgi:hypothetical protein